MMSEHVENALLVLGEFSHLAPRANQLSCIRDAIAELKVAESEIIQLQQGTLQPNQGTQITTHAFLILPRSRGFLCMERISTVRLD